MKHFLCNKQQVEAYEAFIFNILYTGQVEQYIFFLQYFVEKIRGINNDKYKNNNILLYAQFLLERLYIEKKKIKDNQEKLEYLKKKIKKDAFAFLPKDQQIAFIKKKFLQFYFNEPNILNIGRDSFEKLYADDHAFFLDLLNAKNSVLDNAQKRALYRKMCREQR